MDLLYAHANNANKDTKKHNAYVPNNTLFKESFTICYLILFGTAAITFIEAIRTNNIHARYILNLETAVSLTAGFVYGWFREMASKPDFDLKELIHYRYIDWMLTTPMLLLVLLLFINFHSKANMHFSLYIVIVLLNFVMLMFGYMGERKLMDKNTAIACGFLAFGAMIWVIYYYFLRKTRSFAPMFLFIFFSIVWCTYGIAAMLDERNKNLMYNVLDIISKVFIGLGLWGYYGGIITL